MGSLELRHGFLLHYGPNLRGHNATHHLVSFVAGDRVERDPLTSARLFNLREDVAVLPASLEEHVTERDRHHATLGTTRGREPANQRSHVVAIEAGGMSRHDLVDDDPRSAHELHGARVTHVARSIEYEIVERQRLGDGVLRWEVFGDFFGE